MLTVVIVVIVVALLGLVLALLFNRLVRLRNETEAGWANIDLQLRGRNDLIPNLVETVKGYAVHERKVFEEVTRRGRPSLEREGRLPRPRPAAP